MLALRLCVVSIPKDMEIVGALFAGSLGFAPRLAVLPRVNVGRAGAVGVLFNLSVTVSVTE